MRATMGGLLTLAAGVLLRLYVIDDSTTQPFLVLLSITAGLWFVGAVLVLAIKEKEGATDGGRSALEEASAGLRLVHEKPGFRTFIVARALLLSVNLAVPFYTLYARRLTGGQIGGLGLFVIAVGLAEVLSSPFWGRFSDRSSRTVMMTGASLAAVVGISILVMGALPEAWQTAVVLAPVFLLAGFAQAGIRLGRKTYLVDGSPELERPLYVAFSNTIIGVLTLIGGALGLLAEAFGLRLLLIVLVVLTALGALVCWRMPEAEKMTAV
jgi:MFS family permease